MKSGRFINRQVFSRRIFYRISQLWNTLTVKPKAEDLQQISEVLTPRQMALFWRMQPSEQAHSLQVYQQLCSQRQNAAGGPPIDLLVAALLHDVGKIRYPLRVWERIWIVAVQGLFPERAEWLGQVGNLDEKTPWWQRPLVLAAQHARWGGELAEEAGTSPLAVRLIRRHQNFLTSKVVTLEDSLLSKLQAVDGKS